MVTRQRPGAAETRAEVELTNLDAALTDGDPATKRDLIDYLDAVHEPLTAALRGRALSVLRVRPGQRPFMQKNLPASAPDWIRTTTVWAHASQRDIRYALCDDRATLLWFGNQRAVEYHPALAVDGAQTDLIVDLDPPEGGDFAAVVRAAGQVRAALTDSGLAGVVKTSGSKGVHVVVPLDGSATGEDIAAATRAVAVRAERLDPTTATTAFLRDDRDGRVFLDPTRTGGATVAVVYGPRIRPGLPVSYPVDWADLPDVTPSDFTIRTVPALLDGRDPWLAARPTGQALPADLVAEGHTIPVPQVQAMHEGKRRARARRTSQG